MEAEAVLNLFDSLWFYPDIFEKQPTTLVSSNPCPQIEENPLKPNVSTQLSIPTRSKSEELSYYISSPNSFLKPQLETVLSDKEISSEAPDLKKPVKGLSRKKKRLSKSLSELEFEEVKGFMDLGFVFSEEDKVDSSLVEIIPGLQRLGQKTDCDQGKEELFEPRVRPYLSEAWEVSTQEEKALMKWRVPAVSNEVDMKDSLKLWAHTVASAVR